MGAEFRRSVRARGYRGPAVSAPAAHSSFCLNSRLYYVPVRLVIFYGLSYSDGEGRTRAAALGYVDFAKCVYRCGGLFVSSNSVSLLDLKMKFHR